MVAAGGLTTVHDACHHIYLYIFFYLSDTATDHIYTAVMSSFKRKSRPRTKSGFTSPSKAKPLDILPGLTEIEEEDSRASISSAASCSSFSSTSYLSPTYSASRSASGSHIPDVSSRNSRIMNAAERKRDSRRVVLTGAEGLTFEDFFPLSTDPPRPAPFPPAAKSLPVESRKQFSDDPTVTGSPLNSIDFRFSGLNIQFDFPSSPCTRRSHSPTPSVASNRTTSTTASSSSTLSGNAIFTPPTSDDESTGKPLTSSNLMRAPTHKSQRASVYYMKATPDWNHVARNSEPMPQLHRDENEAEDASWIVEELNDIVAMFPDLSEANSHTVNQSFDSRVRPDSVFPLPPATSGRTRLSKPLPVVPRLSIQSSPPRGPSIQLDPTFPQQKRRRTPFRPPPPPPIRIEPPSSPTMEEKTDALLALLANAALDSCFLGTGLGNSTMALPPSVPVTPSSAFAVITPIASRPPPRMSVPADIHDFFDDDHSPDEGDLLSDERDEGIEFDLDSLSSPEWPPTPKNASYSQVPLSIDAIPLEPETPKVNSAFGYAMCMEESPLSPAMPDSPMSGMYASEALPRTLRSRWSSSTLSSLAETRQTPISPSSWKQRFNLGSTQSSKRPRAKSSSSRFSLQSLKTPSDPATQHLSIPGKRDNSPSRAIDNGIDNGDILASSGLRRKPIPVEIFMRA